MRSLIVMELRVPYLLRLELFIEVRDVWMYPRWDGGRKYKVESSTRETQGRCQGTGLQDETNCDCYVLYIKMRLGAVVGNIV